MSGVVHAMEIEPGIVQITMEDRVHKNAFSDALLSGLMAAFRAVTGNTAYKAVIITGYDS
jgi:polyketide biosynthesis enoyl-CoA hydratase PksI